MNKTYKTYWN